MGKFGGYAGNILSVDLTTGLSETKPLPEDMARKYIGNRGLNARLAFDHIPVNTDPLSPDNPLIFGTGLFAGTMVPTSGRNDLTYVSPLSGFIAASSSGQSGTIKFAGFDNLIISGRSDRPVYLKISDNTVEFCEAGDLWGKDVWESTDILRERLGGDYTVSVIGQAGEHLYKSASIVSEKYGFYGQSGSGAVMGSKNLKAIVVKGTGRIEVADPKKFKRLVNELFAEFMTNTDWLIPGTPLDTLENYRALGSLLGFGLGMVPSKNYQGRVPKEVVKAFGHTEFFTRIKDGDLTCTGCPIGCKHRLKLRGGKYSGLTFGASCVGSMQTTWGAGCMINDYDEIIRCAELCARFGMDILATGANAAFALELYQRGIITKADTGGLELEWGNAEAIQELIRKMAFREDIGDILADGVREASRKVGKEAEKYAVQIKGLPSILDLRMFISPESFGNSTAIRGGHAQMWHSSALATDPEKFKKYISRIGIPEDALNRIFKEGSPGYNVPRLTKYNEDFQDLLNLLGICNKPFETVRWNPETLAELYTALTGIEITSRELMRCGERSWNMQKLFNIREGASRKDDLPPRRFMDEGIRIEGWKGKGEGLPPVDEESINRLLTEYYDERGWDPDEGIPAKAKLLELGIE